LKAEGVSPPALYPGLSSFIGAAIPLQRFVTCRSVSLGRSEGCS